MDTRKKKLRSSNGSSSRRMRKKRWNMGRGSGSCELRAIGAQ